MQFLVNEKLKLGDQVTVINELKSRYQQMRKLPNQTKNMNEVQVTLGQKRYDVHQPLEFRMSEYKTSPWAVRSNIGSALRNPLPEKQTATLATTATSITATTDEKIANQLSKWWDTLQIEAGNSKDEQRAIGTLGQNKEFNCKKYKVGQFCKRTT